MKVSIIIPVRYRPDLTRVCLDSIFGYTKDFELIAVQEGEDKEITELLTAYPAKFVQNKPPKGYAGALNAGMKVATGDYFCFMNNDTVATPGWMDEMLKAFNDDDVGLVSPTFWGTGGRQTAIALISHSSRHAVIRAYSGKFPIKKCESTAIQKPSDTGIFRALFP